MQSENFQLGLLHMVHLLVTVDGHIDDRERAAILAIKKEENIMFFFMISKRKPKLPLDSKFI